MIKTRKWPARVIYLIIALALAFGVAGVVPPSSTAIAADPSEWTKVATPTAKDWVVAPKSDFTGIAPAADRIYMCGTGLDMDDLLVDYAGHIGDLGSGVVPQLWKSTNQGATWKTLTKNVLKLIEDEGISGTLTALGSLTCASDKPDIVALKATVGGVMYVFISSNGGTSFETAGKPTLTAGSDELTTINSMSFSREISGKRNLAAAGKGKRAGVDAALIYRFQIGGLVGGWKDATTYPGWDNINDDIAGNDIASTFVSKFAFAPSYATDYTVLAVTHTADGKTYLQSGTWDSTDAWNAKAAFNPAVLITTAAYKNLGSLTVAGLSTPSDYAGATASKRYLWVTVNVLDVKAADPNAPTSKEGAVIFQVRDNIVRPINWQIDGYPLLTSVSYSGTIEKGKALTGQYVAGTGTDCCTGVQTYRNAGVSNMEICCSPWNQACKPPTGRTSAGVFYFGPKAYAMVTGGSTYDESALSFSIDDGDTWNQLSLIDTNIDAITDVAKSPECNKTMLVTKNIESGCGCDSVWLMAANLTEAKEYSGQWLRVWSGKLVNNYGLLRLAPEETDGMTVYLVDRGTETVYYNSMEGLACWLVGKSTEKDIVDLAVKSKTTIYSLGDDGHVAISTDRGTTASWKDPVESQITTGHSIAVKVVGNDTLVLVGGEDADVSMSSDAGVSFTELENIDESGTVHVAFDSYYNDNKTIYAAVTGDACGIYRRVIGKDTKWTDLGATPLESQIVEGGVASSVDVSYYGIVLSYAGGNTYTTAATGGVLYAPYVYIDGNDVYTGVARCLTPAKAVCCGAFDWDYLHAGLSKVAPAGQERFSLEPSDIEICGCLTPATNSILTAVDNRAYYGGDLTDYAEADHAAVGRVWNYEDCFAKTAPALSAPANGATVAADACFCWNDAFLLSWSRPCNACSYDLELAQDTSFTIGVRRLTIEKDGSFTSTGPAVTGAGSREGTTPGFSVANSGLGDGSCGKTYYWRVRVHDAETNEIIHSQWSETRNFVVAAAPVAGIELTAPDNGASNVPRANTGFTWKNVQYADSYTLVLSKSSDLSSPVVTKTGLTTGTAYSNAGPLDYSTTYYWKVTALKGSNVLSVSSVSTFTTVSAPPVAPPPAPAPKVPSWVWVVIGIGAVLVIVVIVLIFRTRRV